MQLDLPQPYHLFLGEETSPRYAKAEVGLRYWLPERCVATVRAQMGLNFLAADRWPEAVYERAMDSGPEALWGAWQ
jgi:hypothetical protein